MSGATNTWGPRAGHEVISALHTPAEIGTPTPTVTGQALEAAQGQKCRGTTEPVSGDASGCLNSKSLLEQTVAVVKRAFPRGDAESC